MLSKFQHCLGQFSILTVERCSETEVFRHLSNHVFRCPRFRNYISYEDYLFFRKCSMLDVYSTNGATISKAVFCFLDNCIETDSCKLSLLQRESSWSEVNMLINSAKISDITKRDNLQLWFSQNDDKI